MQHRTELADQCLMLVYLFRKPYPRPNGIRLITTTDFRVITQHFSYFLLDPRCERFSVYHFYTHLVCIFVFVRTCAPRCPATVTSADRMEKKNYYVIAPCITPHIHYSLLLLLSYLLYQCCHQQSSYYIHLSMVCLLSVTILRIPWYIGVKI